MKNPSESLLVSKLSKKYPKLQNNNPPRVQGLLSETVSTGHGLSFLVIGLESAEVQKI